MKKQRYRRHLVMFFVYSVPVMVVFAVSFQVVHVILQGLGVASALVEYLVGVYVSLLIGGGLVGWVSHRKGHFHQFFYDELYKAIDKVANGEFDISIRSRAIDNHGSFQEIAEKVEHMAAQLKSMETMRRDFVSNVSHEIQSPLTAMKGFLAILRSEDLTEEERISYMKIIDVETGRLSRLSDHLLRLSALDAGSRELNRGEYRLDRQIKESILALEPLWMDKGIEFKLELQALSVSADEDLIAQVWQNLMTNAIKFSRAGGTIEVLLERCGDNICIEVRDHGIGMDEEACRRVFERFYVADKARKRDEGGNGLGLSIVKKIIYLHDGIIKAESQPGAGSCFRIRLPGIV